MKWWTVRERGSGGLSEREEVVDSGREEVADCQEERKWWTVREIGSGGVSGRDEMVECQREMKWWSVRER